MDSESLSMVRRLVIQSDIATIVGGGKVFLQPLGWVDGTLGSGVLVFDLYLESFILQMCIAVEC